jgi:uncharacterized membrane protein
VIYLAFFIGTIIRWLFADIGLHGTYVVLISIFISVIVGKYLKERSVSTKANIETRNKENIENKENTENKEEYTRTESRRDMKRREHEERRKHRRERRNRW